LKTKASFRSFYSTAKVINKILLDSLTSESPALEDSLTPQPLDSLEIKPNLLQELPDSLTSESPLVLPDSTR
jgi:hypothetical protein